MKKNINTVPVNLKSVFYFSVRPDWLSEERRKTLHCWDGHKQPLNICTSPQLHRDVYESLNTELSSQSSLHPPQHGQQGSLTPSHLLSTTLSTWPSFGRMSNAEATEQACGLQGTTAREEHNSCTAPVFLFACSLWRKEFGGLCIIQPKNCRISCIFIWLFTIVSQTN